MLTLTAACTFSELKDTFMMKSHKSTAYVLSVFSLLSLSLYRGLSALFPLSFTPDISCWLYVWQDCQDGLSFRLHQHTCQSLQLWKSVSFFYLFFTLLVYFAASASNSPIHLPVLVCQKMKVSVWTVSEAEGARQESLMDRDELTTSHITQGFCCFMVPTITP